MPHPLDNACWHALASTHVAFSESVGVARRYDPDVAVFSAVDTIDESAWADLGTLAGAGEAVGLFRAVVPEPPEGWKVEFRGRGIQMLLDGPLSAREVPPVRSLTGEHADQMMALIAVTTPGPFRPRTVELGGYVGWFDGDRLLAMAGERLSIDGYGEISAVCTHPDARGRGLAAALTYRVAAGIIERGDVPYLQVAATNPDARRIYERLGFVARRDIDYVMMRTPS